MMQSYLIFNYDIRSIFVIRVDPHFITEGKIQTEAVRLSAQASIILSYQFEVDVIFIPEQHMFTLEVQEFS